MVMEVPEGYKQTELGIIPEDWTDCTLGYLLEENLIEKPLDGNHGDIHPKKSDFVYDGIPFIMANNVTEDGIDIYGCSYIRKEQAESLQKGFAHEGDVLLTHKGTVGNVAIVKDINTAYIMLTPQVTYYRSIDSKKLQPQYIKAFFESSIFQATLKLKAGSGTRAYIGIIGQKELPFVLPTEKEQTAIATTLSDVDALITALKTLIEKKRQIKTATMQRLLTGKQRLPGFGEGKGVQQTELGEIPEDWEITPLNQLASIRSGGTPSTKEPRYWDGKIPWCTPTDITSLNGEKYLYRTERNISNDGLLNSSAEIVPKNSIVMTSRATIGECAIAKTDVTTNQGFKNFICNSTTDNEFLYYLLSKQKERFIGLCSGSTFLEIGTKQLRVFLVAIPRELDEQSAISNVLSGMDNDIQTLETRLAKTQALKQGMMQELLTGRTRLI